MDYRDNPQHRVLLHRVAGVYAATVVYFYSGEWRVFTPALTPLARSGGMIAGGWVITLSTSKTHTLTKARLIQLTTLKTHINGMVSSSRIRK